MKTPDPSDREKRSSRRRRELAGKAVAQMRSEKEFTKQRLAKEAGLSPAMITLIERGDCELTSSTKEAIAKALGHSPSYVSLRCIEASYERDFSPQARQRLTRLLDSLRAPTK